MVPLEKKPDVQLIVGIGAQAKWQEVAVATGADLILRHLFLKNNFIYIFVSGCAGPSLLLGLFSSWVWGATPCDSVASLLAEHGLWGMWAQQVQLPSSRAQAQSLWLTGLVVLQHVGSFQIRGRTHVSCIGRRTPHHRVIRQVLGHLGKWPARSLD